MKDIKKEADKLYSTMENSIEGLEGEEWYNSATKCAIASVENTIKVLEEVKNSITDDWYKVNVSVPINEHTELLNELKSRL